MNSEAKQPTPNASVRHPSSLKPVPSSGPRSGPIGVNKQPPAFNSEATASRKQSTSAEDANTSANQNNTVHADLNVSAAESNKNITTIDNKAEEENKPALESEHKENVETTKSSGNPFGGLPPNMGKKPTPVVKNNFSIPQPRKNIPGSNPFNKKPPVGAGVNANAGQPTENSGQGI